MIDHGVAPSALRMPISLVRSLTAIIMMFETPTTPASSVPMPITQTNARMPLIRLTNCWNSFDRVVDEHARAGRRDRSRGARRVRSRSLVGDRLGSRRRVGVADRHHDHGRRGWRR